MDCDVWVDKATKKRKRGFEREQKTKRVRTLADTQHSEAERRKIDEDLIEIGHSHAEEKCIRAFKRIRFGDWASDMPRRQEESYEVTEADSMDDVSAKQWLMIDNGINSDMDLSDIDLSVKYRQLTAHLQTGSGDFNRRLSAYLTNHAAMRSALDQAVTNSYAQQYPNAPQFAHNQNMHPSPFIACLHQVGQITKTHPGRTSMGPEPIKHYRTIKRNLSSGSNKTTRG